MGGAGSFDAQLLGHALGLLALAVLAVVAAAWIWAPWGWALAASFVPGLPCAVVAGMWITGRLA